MCSGSVLRTLFFAESEVRKVSLPKAAGRTCRLQLLKDRVLVWDLRAFRILCSQLGPGLGIDWLISVLVG